MTENMQKKVSDLFNVFVETGHRLICLTPKPEYKGKIQNPSLFSGEVSLEHINSKGVLYLGITKYATCTTVKGCNVSFETDEPEIFEP